MLEILGTVLTESLFIMSWTFLFQFQILLFHSDFNGFSYVTPFTNIWSSFYWMAITYENDKIEKYSGAPLGNHFQVTVILCSVKYMLLHVWMQSQCWVFSLIVLYHFIFKFKSVWLKSKLLFHVHVCSVCNVQARCLWRLERWHRSPWISSYGQL